MKDITNMLEKIITKENILKNEPMSKHTSFKIGGIADYFIKVKSENELKLLLQFAKENEIPTFIIGNGTNLLIKDGGIRGLVIKLDFKDYTIEKFENQAYIKVQAGMTLSEIALIALNNEFSGLETLAGIPGTIGGAIKMNAGAYGHEMKDIVISSKCMDKNGNILELSYDEHEFEYRKSCFFKNDLIILETTLKLSYGIKSEIKEKMQQYKKARIEKQPLDLPNAGSTFKRKENIAVSKLIDECGLKGYKIGDAEISTKHSGFVINNGNATAKDVINLVDYVKKIVKNQFNEDIELEVIVIGEENKEE